MTKRYAIAATVVFALLVAACGGGRSEGSGVASIGNTQEEKEKDGGKAEKVDREQAGLAFARCMRQNGIDMPDPDADGMVRVTPGARVTDPDAMARAEAACKTEREALQGSMGEPSKDFQDKALAMARCMREQGIDMPDPVMSEGGGAQIGISADQLDSDEFERAQEACRKTVGMPEPGSSGGAR